MTVAAKRPESLEHEAAWWGACANTFHEEQKQLVYAHLMGLQADWECAHPPTFDLGGRSVLDVGGGPASLLLKTANAGFRAVIDPCDYPGWVANRYHAADIAFRNVAAEDYNPKLHYDEAWIYNVLQHVRDPRTVVKCARQLADVVRIFDWVEVPADQFHPHVLHEDELDQWLGGKGTVRFVNNDGAVGWAYFGVFS